MLAQMSHKGSLKALDPEAILLMRDLFIYIFFRIIKRLDEGWKEKWKMNYSWKSYFLTYSRMRMIFKFCIIFSSVSFFKETINSSTFKADFVSKECSFSNLHMRLTAKHVWIFSIPLSAVRFWYPVNWELSTVTLPV